MATTTLLLNGFSVVGDPQANSNASNGGEYMLHSATAVFEDDDIIAFIVENATVDGVLTDDSVITSIIVYDNASDYYNDVAKYTYTGTAELEVDRRTMGDRYLEFEADNLTSSDPGAPTLGTLKAIAGVNVLDEIAAQNGPVETPAIEDIDLDGDGTIDPDEQGDGTLSSDITSGLLVICFAAGTLIETPDGPRFIETLKAGEAVTTLDGGPQDIKWIGRTRVPGNGINTPIKIKRGALGNVRDLWVSPNHRMLVRGAHADLLFGEPEVLVAAKHLANGDTIIPDPRPTITYWHFLCAEHHIIFAEGCASETLYPGAMAKKSLELAEQDELLELMPEAQTLRIKGTMARYALKRHEAIALMARAA